MTNLTSRMITGIVMALGGIVLIIVSFFGQVVVLIYGIPLLIIGLFILFNKNEDKIEEIKSGGKK